MNPSTVPLSISSFKTKCLSEMLGTYILVFLGPGSVVVAHLIPGLSSLEALTLVALVFGCTVTSVMLLLGKRSGAHINPAVSLANTVAGALRMEMFVPYVVFQAVGGLLAGLSLKVVFNTLDSADHLGSTKLAAGVTPIEGIALEALGTFLLAISALSSSSFVHSPVKQGALVGGTLAVLIVIIGPYTGASFNPARSLGPSVFSGYTSGQLVYWVGPLVGAGIAGLIFGALKR